MSPPRSQHADPITDTSATPNASAGRILIVDDDPIIADSLCAFLTDEGFDAATAYNADEALAALREAESPTDGATRKPAPFHVVICDVNMPDRSGMDLLRAAAEQHPDVVFIMLTGYGTIESAVEAIRTGAADYLSKPVVDAELRLTLERAVRQQHLLAENTRLRGELDEKHGLDSIVGADYRMRKAYEIIEAVADSRATILVTGESGTGKTMIARAIHRRSDRRDGPFIEIHCGSIPETLLESELFGHVKGAFTGAHADKPGRFLAADGGTIFIDEINAASPAMQVKLLRVLQERRFEPVGSTQTIEVDTRVLLATNEPLEDLVADGRFRQDLYYRINVIRIELPPLRDRPTDVPLLARHFLDKHAAEHGKTIAGITDEAVDLLQRARLPGNVRELENLLERAVLLSRTPTIDAEDLPRTVTDAPGTPTGPAATGGGSGGGAVDLPGQPWIPIPLADALQEPERRIIRKALEANGWNRQATADQLGINRTTLYKKMKAYRIDQEGA